MTWPIDNLSSTRRYCHKDGDDTVMHIGLLSQDKSNLIKKSWWHTCDVARFIPFEWCEITALTRLSGPQCDVNQIRELYRLNFCEAFRYHGNAFLMQASRCHSRLIKRWAESFGYRYTPILGSLSGGKKIEDYTDNGGSDDEQVILIEVAR